PWTTNSSGVITATLSSTAVGSATITAYLGTADTDPEIGTAVVTIGAGAANAGQSTVAADPDDITTDGTSTITVQLKDAAGNNITTSGGSVFLTTSLSGSSVGSGPWTTNG